MLDLVITGGLVLDGTGAPAAPADVGVAGGRIVEVGRLPGVRAARVIRADGRVVCPGFIDMHAHDDFNLPVNPLAAEKTRQGVTTLVTGNCGLSPAPARDASIARPSSTPSTRSTAASTTTGPRSASSSTGCRRSG